MFFFSPLFLFTNKPADFGFAATFLGPAFSFIAEAGSLNDPDAFSFRLQQFSLDNCFKNFLMNGEQFLNINFTLSSKILLDGLER
jgi:hypothetical protein